MIINKTSAYAIRILLYMTTENKDGFSAKYLYEKLNIKERYLRRILTDLSKSGFIKSSRGRNGGFVFARNIDKIYISEIIEAVQGLEKFQECFLGVGDCSGGKTCEMHHLFAELKEGMNKKLSKTSLKDIKENEINQL